LRPAATDATLLDALGGDRTKMAIVRAAAQTVAAKRADTARATAPVLDAYVA
jgi:hypothetical protein